MGEASDLAFTTMRWNGLTSVVNFAAHLSRLESHARRLGISWPEDAQPKAVAALLHAFDKNSLNSESPETLLVRLSLDGQGEMLAECRAKPLSKHLKVMKDGLHTSTATALPAPRWSKDFTGCKHGEWQPYHDASKIAAERGCAIALLVHDGAVVDAQSATPVLLDDDGVAWFPTPESGAVESISLNMMTPHLLEEGIPTTCGRVTASMVGRAKSLLVVGTGVGVVMVTELDGQVVGDGSSRFAETCRAIFARVVAESWNDISEVRT